MEGENTEKNGDAKFTRQKSAISENADEFYSEDEGRYGWFSYTPDWLQKCNTPKGFLISFGLFSITQGMLVNGLINVSITTLERRFGLNSFQLGLVGGSYDIAFCILCLFVTFYGNHAHRPRLLSIGSVILGTGALIFSLPHFTTGVYVYETDFADICDPTQQTNCETGGEETEDLEKYWYVLILGQLLHGVGATPLYTLGYAFIEDSVAKEEASMYLGLGNALSIFGPVLGYIIGGYLLTVYVDFDSPSAMDNLELTPDDPRWVGAWWVGMLLSAAMAFVLVTVPMAGFPKQLPGTARHRAMRESEVHASAGAEITEQKDFGKSFKDFPIALFRMLRNPTFMLTTLAGCSETLVISGFATFLPKLIENEFNQTAGSAALFAGCISVPGGVVGHVLAGYIVKKLNLSTTGILKYCVVCCAIVIVMSPILLLHCDAAQIAGVNVLYNDSLAGVLPETANLTSPCNMGCACQEEYFIPVCGEDGVGYFSACQAGCDGLLQGEGDNEVYHNCECVNAGNSTASPGLCDQSCNLIAPFLVVFFIVVMICFMSTAPALVVTFRCVPDSQRSFAIGVQWLFMRALGSIPGPLLFGAIIDTTCILWQQKQCEAEQGSCWIYDNDKMGLNMLLIGLGCKILSVFFFGTACYLYKPIQKPEEVELEDKTEQGNGDVATPDVSKSDTVGITNVEIIASKERNGYVNGGKDINEDEPVTEL